MREGEAETFGYDFHVDDGNIPFAPFDIRNVAPIQSEPLRNWDGKHSEPSHDLGNCEPESLCDDLQGRQADVLLSALHIGNVAAIYPQLLGHLQLCPPTLYS